MIILGIETSCDDTAVALVENGRKLIGSMVASQEKIHQKFGGIVPEVASREHLEVILPLLDKLFKKTGLNKNDIDAIAVTNGPGLLGSLLIGVNVAKTLAYLWGKPLIKVDHLIGHIYSALINKPEGGQQFPSLALIISGGHTEIVLVKSLNKFEVVGGTRDDAAGEAFDKAAKILGLGYPGGPAIDKAAKFLEGPVLPRPMLNQGLEMSFSGLKTALSKIKDQYPKSALAFEFRMAVTDVLYKKIEKAIKKYHPKSLIVSGGVSANPVIRDRLGQLAKKYNMNYYVPELNYCMDNAVMIALAAYFLKQPKNDQWYNIEVETNSVLAKK